MKNQDTCAHQHMKLCDECGKPMCADCGAACTCSHAMGKTDNQELTERL